MHVGKSSILGAVAVLAVALSACGSTDRAATTSSTVKPADLTYAQSQVLAYAKPPVFQAPGPAFNASAVMRGKTIYSIPVNAAIDFTQYYRKAAERIAARVGFNFKTWQNAGSPTEWAQGIQTAANGGASLIDLFAGIDPRQVIPQLMLIHNKKIPTVASDTYDLTQSRSTEVTAGVNCPCSTAARLMADWVAVQTKGKANVLFLTSSDVKASQASEQGFKDEFGRVCPSCQSQFIDIPSSNWASKILPQVRAALVSDPKIDYVLPVFDTMAIWATQAIDQSGRRDKVKIVTYNGTPSILKMMHESDVIAMDVGQSNDWMAHVILDQEMRLVAGLPTSPDATWPLHIWTKENLSQTGNPPSDSMGYGSDYQVGFRKLWGLN
jgi:ribose transport system substrate-binding protein